MSELTKQKFTWLETPINKDRARDTGMAITLVFLILGLYLKSELYFKIATLVLVLDMDLPIIFKPLACVWFRVAGIIGTVVSKILLFIVFGVVVMPMALIRRFMGKDPMQLKNHGTKTESAFTIRNHTYTRADIEKPY